MCVCVCAPGTGNTFCQYRWVNVNMTKTVPASTSYVYVFGGVSLTGWWWAIMWCVCVCIAMLCCVCVCVCRTSDCINLCRLNYETVRRIRDGVDVHTTRNPAIFWCILYVLDKFNFANHILYIPKPNDKFVLSRRFCGFCIRRIRLVGHHGIYYYLLYLHLLAKYTHIEPVWIGIK